MFSGSRRFDGRQGEQILNQEQYALYEILRHFLDIPNNPDPYAGPQSDLEKPGALWLDRQTSPGYGHVMYRDNDKVWKPLYDDWFKLIKEIRKANGEPESPLEGQLWINESGVLNWFNGSVFVPIKSSLADTVDFNTNSFQNFLIIDPLKMTGGYIIENLSNLAKIAGSIEIWKANNLYRENDLFYYTFSDNKTIFYRAIKEHTSNIDFSIELAGQNIEAVDLKAQYLIPSEILDKLFIDGYYAENNEMIIADETVKATYEKISDVCIQLSLNIYDGKTIAAVHVNPIALKNIKKRIVKIEKDKSKFNDYAMIKVGPENTEYYGFKGMYGQLLIRGEDYIQKSNGIQLIKRIDDETVLANRCDFDGDSVVSELDLELISAAYGSENQEDLNIYDLNGDGVIDVLDINIVSRNIDHIVNSSNAINQYDFIYCITYEFEPRIKRQGLLYKNTLKLSNRASIWIGELNPEDKLLIFAEGLCLEDFYYEYNPGAQTVDFNGYDKAGNITNDVSKMEKGIFDDVMNVAIFRFGKKTNIGVLTEANLNNEIVNNGETQLYGTFSTNGETRYVARIPLPSNYREPLVFVQGVNLNFILGDYYIDGNYIVIRDALPGKAYYIVDAVREDGFNMYVDQGVIDNTCSIHITDPELLNGDCRPLVFIDGVYISTRDIYFSDSRSLKINGLKADQEYVLLKDKNDLNYQLLYDGTISFTTIALDKEIDDAVLYIANQLIVDNTACTATEINAVEAANNEIKLIITDDGEQIWKYFNTSILSDKNGNPISGDWVVLNDQYLTNVLDLASTGYAVSSNTINILQNYGDMTCTYYAYSFADNIEKPLIKGYCIETYEVDDELFYRLDRSHSYTPGVNALHVWINGIKQKIKEDKYYDNVNGFVREYQGFKIPKPTDYEGNPLTEWPTPFYIIEEPERNENKSCMTEYLTDSIGVSSYTTNNILLAPGIPTLYIDGYRQPTGSYIINNINTFTVLNPVISAENNVIMVTNYNGKNSFVEIKQPSELTIEVRQDYTLKEKTIKLTQQNLETLMKGAVLVLDRSTIFDNDQTLPMDLFMAQSSEINIFINGAMYGDNFVKVKNEDIIILNNSSMIGLLKAGDYITIEWR